MYLSLAEMVTSDDEACDALGLLEKTGKGFKLSMEIPSLLRRFIIGEKGEIVKKIRNDTGTCIWIPRKGEEGDVGETFYEIYIITVFQPECAIA